MACASASAYSARVTLLSSPTARPPAEQSYLDSNGFTYNSGSGASFGLELPPGTGWVLGFDEGSSYNQDFWKYNPSPGSFSGPYDQVSAQISATTFRAGYDWTPLAWRLQPFVPLRSETTSWGMNTYDIADSTHQDSFNARSYSLQRRPGLCAIGPATASPWSSSSTGTRG